MAITFTVLAEAEPKGSTKVLPSGRVLGALRRGGLTVRSVRELLGAVIVTSDNPAVKSWQSRVAFEATTALRGVSLELAGAIAIEIAFYLPRPKSLAKSYTGPHLKKPDLDKLLRSSLDAMTGILWHDDAQVRTIVASKQYAAVDAPVRAEITVTPIANAAAPLFAERTTSHADRAH